MHQFILIAAIFTTVFTFSSATLAQNSAASGPQFVFPLGCTLGTDCWNVNYVDVDPAKDMISDFLCGAKSYDDHKGTDFAVRSMAEINKGVDVLSAADGKVLLLRDGEADTMKSDTELQIVKDQKKECGNALLIDHASAGFGGLRTLYCHLKNDSIVVEKGQSVRAGQKIAQVGHSGLAKFPHLHFGVVWEGGVVDPYTGLLNTEGCGKMKRSLWAVGQPMAYEPATFYDAGFDTKAPDFDAIKKGEEGPEFIKADSPAFVFWIGIYGTIKDDQIIIEIRDTNGELFRKRTITQEITRERQYYYTGRKLGQLDLPPGTYTGTARLKRSGMDDITFQKTITVL